MYSFRFLQEFTKSSVFVFYDTDRQEDLTEYEKNSIVIDRSAAQYLTVWMQQDK